MRRGPGGVGAINRQRLAKVGFLFYRTTSQAQYLYDINISSYQLPYNWLCHFGFFWQEKYATKGTEIADIQLSQVIKKLIKFMSFFPSIKSKMALDCTIGPPPPPPPHWRLLYLPLSEIAFEDPFRN